MNLKQNIINSGHMAVLKHKLLQKEKIMGREKRLFKSEEQKSSSEVSTFLHQLADKISENKIVLRQGQEEISLELPNKLTLEIQVEDEEKGAKGTQHSLEVEIKWFDNDETTGTLELG